MANNDKFNKDIPPDERKIAIGRPNPIQAEADYLWDLFAKHGKDFVKNKYENRKGLLDMLTSKFKRNGKD